MPRRQLPASLTLALAAASASPSSLHAALPLAFERPVVIKQGGAKQHAWFPEGGAVIGGVNGAPQAVITAVRFNGDGGPPLPGHTDEALISWDAGRSYSHLGWSSLLDGTATFLDQHGGLRFSQSLKRDATNTSFTGLQGRIVANKNRTLSRSTLGKVMIL